MFDFLYSGGLTPRPNPSLCRSGDIPVLLNSVLTPLLSRATGNFHEETKQLLPVPLHQTRARVNITRYVPSHPNQYRVILRRTRMSASESPGKKVRGTELRNTDSREVYRQKLARITLDSMVQFVGLLDTEGTVLEINQVALDGGGLKLADVEGRPFWTTFWWQVSPEINAVLKESIARAAKGEFVRWDTEIYGRAGGRETIVIDASLCPVLDENGVVVFIAAEGRDITEKKAYGREIARQREELAKLDELKTQFFANISHEFRTPLTLMMGPLEDALARPEELSESNREQLQLAHRNSLRLLKLVNTLLDFSRIEAGRIRASYQPTNLAALTTELASVFRSAIERAGIKLVLDCDPLSEPAYVDREMWEKILFNLISNAFKFTFSGEITVSLVAVDKRIELQVRDTGTGIPAEEIPRLFDRFHRVEGARGRSFEGSGIGLALVSELVKLHGGSIRVESALDRGSAFVISIPKGKSHLPQDRIGAARVHVSTSVQSEAYEKELARWLPDSATTIHDELSHPSIEKSRRILLVDDNIDMRDYVRRLLEQSGYEVEAVEDGLAAVRAARGRKPDLVLTDVMMPGLDGFGLVREFRADPELCPLPIILVSARAGEEARIEGINAGADDYIIKPFGARELLARIDAQLKMATLRQATTEALRLRTVQFETLFNRTPMGVSLIDGDFRIREVNPIARPAFGKLSHDIVGRDFADVMLQLGGKPYADRVVGIIRHTLQTGESYITQDWAAYRIDQGITQYYEWRADRIVLPDSSFGVVCYFRDISERKSAEQNLHLLASIVESSDDAIVSKTLDGTVMSWNGGAYRLFGYTPSEIVGRPIAVLIPPDRLAEEPAIIEKLKGGSRTEHFETVRVRKDGSLVNVSVTLSLVKDDYGNIVGASKIARDITDRLRQKQAIQAANQALTRANSSLQDFADSASHDLQEPLRAVTIYNQLLQKQFAVQLGPVGESYVARAIGGALRMQKLLKDLRNYAEASSTTTDAEQDVDSGEVLATALSNLEVAIRESGATITTSKLPRVRMHGFHLAQIFQNLIGNAIHHRGALSPVVHVAAECRGTAWQFSVQDNGVGIEPQYTEQIFGIFKRLHSTANYSGTGMGLAICQRSVERAGGKIWVESEPGTGSTFFFTIPT